MKNCKFFLGLFYLAFFLVVFFKLIESEVLVLCIKAFISPLLLMYYLESIGFKKKICTLLVFLICFIGDAFVLLKVTDTVIGGLISFLLLYLLMLKFAYEDFKSLKFTIKDSAPILLIVGFLLFVLISILSLNLENLKIDFYFFVVYGISLLFLSSISFINYYKKPSFSFMNLFLMCVCFIISDVFFIIYNFYFELNVFGLLSVITQVPSYYFMTIYFIEKDNKNIKLSNNG